MNINGHFEQVDSANRRGAARRTLRLGVAGRFGSGRAGAVTVRNLSATGLLIETEADLREGDTFVVALPQAGEREATVAWADAPHFGCRFAVPLGAAGLAAAQLGADAAGPAPDLAPDLAPDPAPDPAPSEPFGARLRRLRTERGLSMGQIAARLAVSKPTVWAWEHGKSRPVERRLADLARVLGVAPGGLEPEHSGVFATIERSRRAIADAYGVEPARIRIMIDL